MDIFSIGFSFDSTWQSILYILCGLGIFLYGIDLMGKSLKAIAGERMRVIIEKSTNTPLKGMLVGFITTMLTQSASGTSALAVSLVSAGLMSFEQSLGVLLGANIGGTVLTIILAGFSQLKIMPIVSVVLVFVGVAMIFFIKNKKVNQIGAVVLGFGLIFLGLAFIDMSFKYILKGYNDTIQNIFKAITPESGFLSVVPVLGVLIGTIVTVVVQSSSATIGIVQSMFQGGTISLSGSLAIMLGANIGTTITALLASMGASRNAKKVAVANSLIKLFGAVVFMCAFYFYDFIVVKIADALNWNGQLTDSDGDLVFNPMIIALAHLAFNIINSFAFLLLLKPLAFVCGKMFGNDNDSEIEERLLDYSLIKKSPALALSFAKSAIDYMSITVKEYVHITKSYAFERNDDIVKQGEGLERIINCLDKRIHDYLIKLTISDLNAEETQKISKYLDAIKDLERVGDHCTNIIGFFVERYDKEMHLSEDGVQDLEQIFDALISMTDILNEAITSWNSDIALKAEVFEDEIDKMEEFFHQRHVHRVTSGNCSFTNTEHYVETLSNIERMGDHLMNICELIANEQYCQYDEFNH